MLEPTRIDADAVYWLNETAEEAPDLVHSLDSRIWSSVTLGHVELPGGKVTAEVWFRLMQTINEELSRRLYGSWNNNKLIQEVWAAADCCPRAGTTFWKSFEFLSPHRRRSRVIATAIDMIERGSISPLGVDARFFCPRL